MMLVNLHCAVGGDQKKDGFVGRCSTGISQFGQGIFCIAVMLVLHFHIMWGRNGVVLNKGAQQDPHGPNPPCWEVHKDDGLCYEVLESW